MEYIVEEKKKKKKGNIIILTSIETSFKEQTLLCG